MKKNIILIVVVLLFSAGLLFYLVYYKLTNNQIITNPTPIATTSVSTTPSYINNNLGFSLNLPVGYTVDENYTYQALGPDNTINGVKFTIPESLATGTNLSTDSYISIEELPNSDTCLASEFLMPGTMADSIVDNNTKYSYASTTDAGAGNRYAETVYSIPGSNPCIAVRYYVHYAVFENFPVGTIKEFNLQNILGQFDNIRRTLIVK